VDAAVAPLTSAVKAPSAPASFPALESAVQTRQKTDEITKFRSAYVLHEAVSLGAARSRAPISTATGADKNEAGH